MLITINRQKAILTMWHADFLSISHRLLTFPCSILETRIPSALTSILIMPLGISTSNLTKLLSLLLNGLGLSCRSLKELPPWNWMRKMSLRPTHWWLNPSCNYQTLVRSILYSNQLRSQYISCTQHYLWSA